MNHTSAEGPDATQFCITRMSALLSGFLFYRRDSLLSPFSSFSSTFFRAFSQTRKLWILFSRLHVYCFISKSTFVSPSVILEVTQVTPLRELKRKDETDETFYLLPSARTLFSVDDRPMQILSFTVLLSLFSKIFLPFQPSRSFFFAVQ